MNRTVIVLILMLLSFAFGKVHGTKAWDLFCETGEIPGLSEIWAPSQQPVTDVLPMPNAWQFVPGSTRDQQQQVQPQQPVSSFGPQSNPLRHRPGRRW
jgi:hypothetical protein